MNIEKTSYGYLLTHKGLECRVDRVGHVLNSFQCMALDALFSDIEQLRAEHAASQAREGALRKALEECLSWVDAWCDTSPETGFDEIERLTDSVLDMPTDDTALRQAIKVAKEEMRERAARVCATSCDTVQAVQAIRALEVE